MDTPNLINRWFCGLESRAEYLLGPMIDLGELLYVFSTAMARLRQALQPHW